MCLWVNQNVYMYTFIICAFSGTGILLTPPPAFINIIFLWSDGYIFSLINIKPRCAFNEQYWYFACTWCCPDMYVVVCIVCTALRHETHVYAYFLFPCMGYPSLNCKHCIFWHLGSSKSTASDAFLLCWY